MHALAVAVAKYRYPAIQKFLTILVRLIIIFKHINA
jgi:hypothetical protein